MQTQWRAIGLSAGVVYQGLEYASLPVVAKAAGYELDQHLLKDIVTLEHAGVIQKNKRT